MIVVVIVGILAMIAISAYQEYSIRARVMEGLILASPAKLAVSEMAIVNKVLPTTQGDTEYISPDPTDKVTSVEIGSNGVITIIYTPKAGDGTIILTPILQANGEITWDCKSGTLESKYRPVICRP